jgi:hypothetical protein
VDAASGGLIQNPCISSAALARQAQQTALSMAPQEMQMRVDALEQTNFSTGYESSPLERPEAGSARSTGLPDILVLALWSGIGLVMSVPFIPLLSKATVDEDTFSLLAGLLG